MGRPMTLMEPWRSLAGPDHLGSAGALYAVLMVELGCSEPTAKRICKGTGQLTYAEWCKLDALFQRHNLPLIV